MLACAKRKNSWLFLLPNAFISVKINGQTWIKISTMNLKREDFKVMIVVHEKNMLPYRMDREPFFKFNFK